MSLENDYKIAEAKLKAFESTPWFHDYQKCKKERDRLKRAFEKDRYSVLSKNFFDELLPIFENCLKEASITLPVTHDIQIAPCDDGTCISIDEKVLKPIADLVNKYTDASINDDRQLYEMNIIIEIDEYNQVYIGEQGDYDEIQMSEVICGFKYLPHMPQKIVGPTIHQRKKCDPFLNKITKYQKN